MGDSARRIIRAAGHVLGYRWRGVPVWALLLAATVIAVVAVRVPAAVTAVAAVFTHGSRLGARWPWVGVVIAGELLSLAGATMVQRELLGAGGSRLRWRVLFGLSLVTAGLTRVLPAGLVAGGSWLAGEYRRRGVAGALAVWAVLAGGFASTVSILALLLAGAAVGRVAGLPLLAGAAALLAVGSAGLIAALHGAGGRGGWLRRRLQRTRWGRRMMAAVGAVLRLRAGRRRWLAVLAASGVGWLGDTGVLAASFGLAGLAVPWRGLLFACAAGQLAGRLVPLPGGLGGVEGGLIGALTLTGTTAAAAAAVVILYRVVGYWAVGGAGGAALAALSRRSRRPDRAGEARAGQAVPAGEPVPARRAVPAGRGRTAGHAGLPPAGEAAGHRLPVSDLRRAGDGRPAGSPPPAGGRPPARGRRVRWLPEFVLVAALLWGVNAVDKFRPGAAAAGLAHAAVIDAVSRSLDGGVSLPMNAWLAAHPLPAAAAAAYYIVLNVAVTGAAGVMLLLRRPRGFSLHRNALLMMGLLSLVVWWVYPVAPPRMLPGYHDITAAAVPVFAHLLEGNAADEFAALPSIHVAWALWVAVVAQVLLRRRRWRVAVWAYPLLTVLDVLVTANHYLLDVIAAPAAVLLAYALAALVTQVRLPGRGQARPPRAGVPGRPAAPAGTWPASDPLPSQAPATRTRKLLCCLHH